MDKGYKLSEEWKKNIGLGNLGRVVSEETKKKISESLKGNIPWNIGIPRSDETKQKLREAHIGKHNSEETRKKLSEANSGENHWNFGKHHSDETKLKMSISAKARTDRVGKPHTEEQKEKQRQLMLGKHPTAETRLKMSISGKGRIFSEEHKRKIGDAQLGEKNHSFGKLGENSSNWNGGRRKTKFGYILIYKPEHPFCDIHKYFFEHRAVMEEFIGRYLLPEEVVHHINSITDDNRLENLMLFKNNGEHKKHHGVLKKELIA